MKELNTGHVVHTSSSSSSWNGWGESTGLESGLIEHNDLCGGRSDLVIGGLHNKE